MADQTLQIIIKGTDENATDSLRKIQGEISGLEDSFNMLDHAINLAGEILANFITDALYAAGRAIANLASEMISSNAQFEQYTTQFGVLLGSVDAAEERMAELAEFGRTTPFDLPGVVEADRILQSFGLHAEDIADRFGFAGDEIRRIAGDVAAGTGTSFQEMATLIGRFASGATGEAIMRMQELGIGTRLQMAELGLEFSKSGQLLSPLPEAMEVVLQMMQDKFGGMMEAQSATFEGMMSNLRDWIGQTIRAIGQPIFERLREKLGDLLVFLGSTEVQGAIAGLAEMFGNLAEDVFDLAVPAFEGLLEVVVPLINYLSFLISEGDALNDWLGHLPEPMQNIIRDTLDWITSLDLLIGRVEEFLTPIMDWISQNVELEDVLLAVGAVIAAVVIPSVVAFVQAAAPIVALFAGLVAGAGLLRDAWDNDFAGIRAAITAFWHGQLLPAVKEIKRWFDDELPPIIERFAETWREEVLPELSEIADVLEERILPLFGGDLPTFLEVVFALLEGGTLILNDLATAFANFADWFADTSEKLTTFFDEGEIAGDQLIAAFDDLGEALNRFIEPWRPLLDEILPGLQVEVPAVSEDFDLLTASLDALVGLVELETAAVQGLTDMLNAGADSRDSILAWVNTATADMTSFVDNAINRVTDAWQAMIDVWNTNVQPPLTDASDFLNNDLIPVFEALGRVITELNDLRLLIMAGIWENVVLPALTTVWEFIDQNILSVFRLASDIIGNDVNKASNDLALLWTNTLLPALTEVWEFIDANLMPIFNDLSEMIRGTLGEAWGWFLETILDPVKDAFEHIDDTLRDITMRLNNFANDLESLDEALPDWLTPGSPTPFELGLEGISRAMDQLSNANLPNLGSAFDGLSLAGAGGGIPAGGNSSLQEIYNLTINSNAPAESAVTDLSIMRTLAGNSGLRGE